MTIMATSKRRLPQGVNPVDSWEDAVADGPAVIH